MKTNRLNQAIIEAKRFLTRAETYCTELEMRDLENSPYKDGKQTASIKRASLDLTRALAELRKLSHD